MAKSLLLAEKPSQAQDLAKGFGGAFGRKEGYLEGEECLITWCFGHLVELEDAEAYGEQYAKWDIGTLPIFPAEFKYRIKPDARKQFRVIKDLLHREGISRVVVCTDPGREGELIARLVLRLAGSRLPVKRFWVSKALTAGTVREGFAQLKDGREYDALFLSAQLRQWADWIIGINGTRAFSAAFGGVYSIGRVQTPTLKILVDREKEIGAFKPRDYWTVKGLFRHANGTYEGLLMPCAVAKQPETAGVPDEEGEEDSGAVEESKFRFYEKQPAETAVEMVRGKSGVVKSASEKECQESPPHLFSLTDLQKEANRFYGLSAKNTLDIAQALYEKHKAISYPRTESRHLNEEMAEEVRRILNTLHTEKYDAERKAKVDPSDKRVFDGAKLTDHHALIPTDTEPENPSDDEEKIYKLVVRRFVAAFYPPRKYKALAVTTAVGRDEFISSGMVVVDDGWRAVYGGGPGEKLLPAMKQGDRVETQKADVEQKKTIAPPRYTDASILSAMTNAQRFVSDPRLKAALRDAKGLGTPATRAAILEALIAREYVRKEGKRLVPTEKGVFLIERLKGQAIADPAYTALWERELEELAATRHPESATAEEKAREFLGGIKGYVGEIVNEAKKLADGGAAAPGGNGDHAGGSNGGKNRVGKCPQCGSEVFEGAKGYFCANGRGGGAKGTCDFALWKNCLSGLGKKSVSSAQAACLLAGETVELKGLKSRKGGKPFSAGGKLSRHEKYGWQVEVIAGRTGANGNGR